MLEYGETHLVESTRVELACDFLVHEFGKLFRNAGYRDAYESIRSAAPKHGSSEVAVRDFWNLFCAISNTLYLKKLYEIVTDENMVWAKQEISIAKLIPRSPQGWMKKVSLPRRFDQAVSYLQSESALEEARNDADEYEKKHISGMESDPLIGVEEESNYIVDDGNGRLAHKILQWVVGGANLPHPAVSIWVGRSKDASKNYWIPTSSLVFFNDLRNYLRSNPERLLEKISQLALVEFQKRVSEAKNIDIERLAAFVEADRKEMVDFIQGNQRPIAIGNNVYGRLLNVLVSEFPMEKDGTSPVVDKAHIELAIAILQAVWCGWLSQAKANRGIYAKGWPEKFNQVIDRAFEIGQDYARIAP